jgi:hypothetical protein
VHHSIRGGTEYAVSQFYALHKESASVADVAGIHNVNKAEEHEAMVTHTADEKPH